MLVEIAIADAYGAGFEFKENDFILSHHKMDKYRPAACDNLAAGCYTDDTQMSLAIAELLNEHDGDWTPSLVAEYFLKAFHRDKREGYAKGFYGFLCATHSSKEFLEKIISTSNKNGAAMRSVPLGLIKNVDELLAKAEIQASVTHNSPSGIFSAKAVALAAHYSYYRIGKMSEIANYVSLKLNHPINTNKTSRVECDALETIYGVFTVLAGSLSLLDVLDKSILLGGDTDSVAAIACGIASLSDEFDHTLPSHFYSDLENNEYGLDYLKKIDSSILAKYSK